MAAKFRVIVTQADDQSIVDEAFTAESVEQILRSKPDGVKHVEAAKVRDIGPESVSDEAVWLELISMRENLAEACSITQAN
jgi:hypothetical protein